MANPENLVPNEDRTPEERRENARKAGIASGVARRKKRDLREACLAILESEITTKKGEKMTGSEAMVAKLFQQAMNGNIKAFVVLRDTAGQKPVERIQVAEVEQSIIDEVESIVTDATATSVASELDDASSYARDDADTFTQSAPDSGIVASEQPETKTKKKRTTKKKTKADSPFFDAGDGA